MLYMNRIIIRMFSCVEQMVRRIMEDLRNKGLCRIVHASLYMCLKHKYHTYGTVEKLFEELLVAQSSL